MRNPFSPHSRIVGFSDSASGPFDREAGCTSTSRRHRSGQLNACIGLIATPIALDIETKHPVGSGEGLCGTLLPCFSDGCLPP
jgi:hypothetical protein